MVILGISAFGENPAACVVVDGILRAFCHEERFTRLKVSTGFFPVHSLNWCLKSTGLTLPDVGRIAVSWDCKKYPWSMLRHLAGMKLRLLRNELADRHATNGASGSGAALTYLLDHTPATFEHKIRDHLRGAGHKGKVPPVVFVPHHDAHAYQAFYQSPFADAAVLVADGSGEQRAVSGYHFGRHGIRECFSLDVPQSLGWYYSAFTAYLGFHANRDEGKLMGLAAYGTGRRNQNPWLERLDRVIRVTSDGFELDPWILRFGGNEHHPRFSDALRRLLLSYDPTLEPVGLGETAECGRGAQPRYLLPAYVDLAYAVQDRLEAALLALVGRLRRHCETTRLCVAGGVFMNCKANGRILDEGGASELFVHPAASDDGSAIGAAFYVAKACDRLLPNPLLHAQLGPSFANPEIERALEVAGSSYTAPADICQQTAELLARGKFCGWFQGGLEAGARALGGRSIIACPQARDTAVRINASIKFREAWRPYCPSMAAESNAVYTTRPVDTPFMTIARTASGALKDRGPATVHVDGTVRPQTVRQDSQPVWYRLLSEVGRRTGDPLVLNTSLNIRGEPIVCSPLDAIRCFYSTGLDALAIGPFLVTKHGKSTAAI